MLFSAKFERAGSTISPAPTLMSNPPLSENVHAESMVTAVTNVSIVS